MLPSDQSGCLPTSPSPCPRESFLCCWGLDLAPGLRSSSAELARPGRQTCSGLLLARYSFALVLARLSSALGLLKPMTLQNRALDSDRQIPEVQSQACLGDASKQG